ncbi:MAG: Trm112 family protein [Pseudomonadota bacterium]
MSGDTATPPIGRTLLETLVCPSTGGRLTYDPDREELISKSAGVAYPIRSGIPIMLIDEARQIED